jgi:hypothetical protein
MTRRDGECRPARCGFASRCLWCLAVLLWLASPQAGAQEAPARSEVWLVTYGPGEIYWQRFGHNGIWIRDADLGLDHVFNFGFFDFGQQDFLWHFLQGRLWYFSAAQPAQREFAQYINENRSIRAQRLGLSEQQALHLADYLINEVQPQNRDYLYDYYWNNCSTRVRDALDMALENILHDRYGSVAAGQNLRDHTRRLTIADYWLYLGLELGLGSPVDRPVTRWDEFFVPGQLAEGLAQWDAEAGADARPLVLEDVMLYRSTLPPPPPRPAQWWPRYLALAAALLALAIALCRLVPWLQPVSIARSWLSIGGLLGCAMLYLWFLTDHQAARDNLNLLLFNPLWLLCWAGRRGFLPAAGLLAGLGLVAAVQLALPSPQYNADVLAAALPLNMAAAWVLYRASRPAPQVMPPAAPAAGA